jgi:hypothetical protein
MILSNLASWAKRKQLYYIVVAVCGVTYAILVDHEGY